MPDNVGTLIEVSVMNGGQKAGLPLDLWWQRWTLALKDLGRNGLPGKELHHLRSGGGSRQDDALGRQVAVVEKHAAIRQSGEVFRKQLR